MFCCTASGGDVELGRRPDSELAGHTMESGCHERLSDIDNAEAIQSIKQDADKVLLVESKADGVGDSDESDDSFGGISGSAILEGSESVAQAPMSVPVNPSVDEPLHRQMTAGNKETVLTEQEDKQQEAVGDGTGSNEAVVFETAPEDRTGTTEEQACTLVSFLPAKTDDKPILVLDLDHTLVYPTSLKQSEEAYPVEITVKDNRQVIWVQERPHAREFIRDMAEHYEVILFTAGIRQYAEFVMRKLDPQGLIKSLLDRSHCTAMESVGRDGGVLYLKELKYLGRDLKRTIIVDDREYSYIMNYINGQYIPPFYGDRGDSILLDLRDYLLECLLLKDFTTRTCLSYDAG